MDSIQGLLVRDEDWTIIQDTSQLFFWVTVLVKLNDNIEVKLTGKSTRNPKLFDIIDAVDCKFDGNRYTTRVFLSIKPPTTTFFITLRLLSAGICVDAHTVDRIVSRYRKDVWHHLASYMWSDDLCPQELRAAIRRHAQSEIDDTLFGMECESIFGMLHHFKVSWGPDIVAAIVSKKFTIKQILEDPLCLIQIDAIKPKMLADFCNRLPHIKAETKDTINKNLALLDILKQVSTPPKVFSKNHNGKPFVYPFKGARTQWIPRRSPPSPA